MTRITRAFGTVTSIFRCHGLQHLPPGVDRVGGHDLFYWCGFLALMTGWFLFVYAPQCRRVEKLTGRQQALALELTQDSRALARLEQGIGDLRQGSVGASGAGAAGLAAAEGDAGRGIIAAGRAEQRPASEFNSGLASCAAAGHSVAVAPFAASAYSEASAADAAVDAGTNSARPIRRCGNAGADHIPATGTAVAPAPAEDDAAVAGGKHGSAAGGAGGAGGELWDADGTVKRGMMMK